MPRRPRLDAPGSWHHIMARKIEKKRIFKSERDKEDFLTSLGKVVTKARSIFCYLSSRQLGWTGRQLSKALHITPAAIHYAAVQGETFLRQNRGPEERITKYLKNLTTSP